MIQGAQLSNSFILLMVLNEAKQPLTTTQISGPSGARSLSVTSNGEHQSNSHNFLGLGNCADTTCSGTK